MGKFADIFLYSLIKLIISLSTRYSHPDYRVNFCRQINKIQLFYVIARHQHDADIVEIADYFVYCLFDPSSYSVSFYCRAKPFTCYYPYFCFIAWHCVCNSNTAYYFFPFFPYFREFILCQTVNNLRPFFLLLAKTLFPLLVLFLTRNP